MITSKEQKRAKELSKSLSYIIPKNKADRQVMVGNNPATLLIKNGLPGKDGSPDTPEEIAAKLNTLRLAVNSNVIKGLPDKYELVKSVIQELKSGRIKLDAKTILNLPTQTTPPGAKKSNYFGQIDNSDLRWHGSGVPALAAGTNITLTPLSGGGYTISASGGGAGGGSFSRQVVSGVINGVNKTFTIPTAVVGSSFIDLSGSIQADGGIDYTLSGTTITYVTAPPAGATTHYLYAGGGTTSSWVMDSTPTGTVDGSNLTFTVPVACTQVVVYSDGLRVKGSGVTYDFDGTSTITFTAGNAPGSTVSCDYLPS